MPETIISKNPRRRKNSDKIGSFNSLPKDFAKKLKSLGLPVDDEMIGRLLDQAHTKVLAILEDTPAIVQMCQSIRDEKLKEEQLNFQKQCNEALAKGKPSVPEKT